MSKPLVIIGGGGHASVLLDMLLKQNREVLALVSPDIDSGREVFTNIQHLTSDDEILTFDKSSVNLVNGIGSLPGDRVRDEIYKKFTSLGYEFESVVSDDAVISRFVSLGNGVQIMAGVVIQPGVVIGSNTIVNTGAVVDHDCMIGSNNHIAPGVTLSGSVISGKNVHFGTGASVIHSIKIGPDAVIGAGATITQNVFENTLCLPAKVAIRDRK